MLGGPKHLDRLIDLYLDFIKALNYFQNYSKYNYKCEKARIFQLEQLLRNKLDSIVLYDYIKINLINLASGLYVLAQLCLSDIKYTTTF
jgi:hypothetical protein